MSGRLPKHWENLALAALSLMKPDLGEREKDVKKTLETSKCFATQWSIPTAAYKKWCGAGVRDETQPRQRLFGPLGADRAAFYYNATSLSRPVHHLVKECICRRTTMPINYASAFRAPLFFLAQVQSGRSQLLRRISCGCNPSPARAFPLSAGDANGTWLSLVLSSRKVALGLSWRLA